MKKLAQIISKKLSDVKSTTDENTEHQKSTSENPVSKTNETNFKEDVNEEESIYGPDGNIDLNAAIKVIKSQKSKEDARNNLAVTDVTSSLPSTDVTSTPSTVVTSTPSTDVTSTTQADVIPTKSEVNNNSCKKQKIRRKSNEHFATYDGQIIPYLLKKRKYKKSGQSENKEKYISQDDYVLKKLFSKGKLFVILFSK